VATELYPASVRCARSNGVDVHQGDLFDPLPDELRGRIDVVTAVAPYVPTDALRLLPRDVQTYEPRLALDGGPDGLRLLRRVVAGAAAWMSPGGSLLLELGADQADRLDPDIRSEGFREITRLVDDDGDLRGVCARVP
jgi:release factor glutamine methyltransferase